MSSRRFPHPDTCWGVDKTDPSVIGDVMIQYIRVRVCEGDCWPLYDAFEPCHIYNRTLLETYGVLIERREFSHLTSEELIAALLYNPKRDLEWYCGAPRFNISYTANCIAYRHGITCALCHQVKKPSERYQGGAAYSRIIDPTTPYYDGYRLFNTIICDDCVKEIDGYVCNTWKWKDDTKAAVHDYLAQRLGRHMVAAVGRVLKASRRKTKRRRHAANRQKTHGNDTNPSTKHGPGLDRPLS
jgi:hypothetical protein